MDKEDRRAELIELAETIADNKFILGDVLVKIGISGPNLESSLASIAMAQAELGHARLMYRWIDELKGSNQSKSEVKSQTGKAFNVLVDTPNWISLIANLFVINVGCNAVAKSILEANHPEVNPPFAKMLKEQEEHIIYAESWCVQLLQDRGKIPALTEKALEMAAKEVKTWVQQVAVNSDLQRNGYLLETNKIVSVFNERIHLNAGVMTNG